MMLNLTQHTVTLDQINAGVIEPKEIKDLIVELITFKKIPSHLELANNAEKLVKEVSKLGYSKVLIGGAPFFMPFLELALFKHSITPYYSFSERVVKEEVNSDGKTIKTSVFKHVGFIKADKSLYNKQ